MKTKLLRSKYLHIFIIWWLSPLIKKILTLWIQSMIKYFVNYLWKNIKIVNLHCCRGKSFLGQKKRFRSFQRGIVGIWRSKDCKPTTCQSWGSEKNPAPQPELSRMRAAWVQVLDHQIIMKVWQTTTLHPFDLQRLKVPPLKI